MERLTRNTQKVLQVDDDVGFLEVNKAAVEAAGHQVELAQGMKEALDAVRGRTIDVALLDGLTASPDQGFPLARALRKDERTGHIALLMLTSVNAVIEAKGFLFRLSDVTRTIRGCRSIVFSTNPSSRSCSWGSFERVLGA